MRISTSEMQRQAVNSLLEQQLKISKIQQQLSTGERFSTPAEDPIAAVNVLDLHESLETTRQYQDNANIAKTRLNIEETVFFDIENKMQRVRQLVIQGANDTVNADDRGIIAQEIELLLEGLVELGNAKDANGEYLFSGYQGRTQPFTQDANGVYSYNGDEGQRFLQVGPTRQVAIGDAGKEVFGNIKTIQAISNPVNSGSGAITAGAVVQPDDYQPHNFTITFTSPNLYKITNSSTSQTIRSNQAYEADEKINFNGIEVTIDGLPQTGDSFIVAPAANENVFNSVSDVISTLQSAPNGGPGLKQFHEDVNNAINNIDQAMDAISNTHTKIGGRLNAIESQEGVNDAFAFQMEKSISELKDLDFVDAISKFNLQLTALQAAQSAYLKIQNLSLFNQL